MGKESLLLTLILTIILISATVSAQVIVVGKVYSPERGFGKEVSNADVTATCDSLDNSTTQTTQTISGGTFAFLFTNETCGVDDLLKLKAEYNGKKEELSARLLCNESICYDEPHRIKFIVVADFVLPENINSGSGGGGGGGSTIQVTPQIDGSFPPVKNEEKNGNVNLEEENGNNLEKEQPRGLARITGAVIGALGTTGSWMLIIGIIVVLIILAAYFNARRAKTTKVAKSKE